VLVGSAHAGRRNVMAAGRCRAARECYSALMKKGTSLAVGIAIGAAIGVALDNIAMGTGIGVALGIAMGLESRD